MDSPSPSISACDSSYRSDARNGEGLAVDEIMRMKERRLRLLDDYRNEQEDIILPLMREADDINKKRKKKSKSQCLAENNTPLRRSERIMIQTLIENGTLDSPVHQPQLEPDPISEPQYEPGFEPEPEPTDESEPEPKPTDESEPEPESMNKFEPEPAPMNEFEPEPAPMNEFEPEPAPVDEFEPEPAPVDGAKPESEPTDQSQAEFYLINGSEPDFYIFDESDLEPVSTYESEQGSLFTDESGSDSTSTDDSEPEFQPRGRFPNDQPWLRRLLQRLRPPRHRFMVWIGDRYYYDAQMVARRVFAVYLIPLNSPEPVAARRRRRARSDPGDNGYGERQGFNVGYRWTTRVACSHDKVHRPSVAGIHVGPDGAYSVALSGAYPEDVDYGNVVIFTGAGGRDLKDANGRSISMRNAPQVRDQELNKFNLSLIRSLRTGNPVRLIRGPKLASSYAPDSGYRYDGLYRVVQIWYTRGVSGFHVFRFTMFRLANQSPPPWGTVGDVEIPYAVPAPLPRYPIPLPSISAATPSTSAGPPSKRAKRKNGSFPRSAVVINLDQENEESVNRLRQDLSHESDEEDGSPSVFRGRNVP